MELILEEYLNQSTEMYWKVVEVETRLLPDCRTRLLRGDLEHIKKEDGIDKFIQALYKFTMVLNFHKDEDILRKYKEFGFSQSPDSFFIAFEDLDYQLNKIEEAGVRIDRAVLLLSIKQHLLTLAAHNIQKDFFPGETKGKKSVSAFEKSLHLYVRSRKRSSSQGELLKGKNAAMKAAFDDWIGELASEHKISREETTTILKQSAQGKTESIVLKFILEDCFYPTDPKMSKTKLYNIVYDLFALVAPQLGKKSEGRYDYSKTLENEAAFYAKRLQKFIYKNY